MLAEFSWTPCNKSASVCGKGGGGVTQREKGELLHGGICEGGEEEANFSLSAI